MAENTNLDKVWFIVTPHNPHKKRETLADDYDRLNLVELAIADNAKLEASDIEFDLPKPSYTVDTLAYLKAEYPQHQFVLIMGGDNLGTLRKWKNYEYILAHHDIYVYKRPNYDLGDLQNHEKVHLFEVPSMDISSTFIRQQIKAEKSIRYLVPDSVNEEIEKSGLFKEVL